METSVKSKTEKNSNLGGPWRITFDTNPDDCNMYCIMCEEHSEFSPLKKERIKSGRPHRRMNFDIIRRTVEHMSGFGLKEIIPSTMGEPLLYEHFEDIINICKEYNVKLNLTTNGTWPVLGPEKWAKVICPVASDVKISWNGSSEEVQEGIMKGSRFVNRMTDLRKFISVRDQITNSGGNRCSITLQATFMEANLEDLPGLVNLALELGIDRVKGHHLWAHFNKIKELDLRRDLSSVKRWNRIVDKCETRVKETADKGGNKLKLDNFLRLNEDDYSKAPDDWTCPFLGEEAWVNFEGRFDPCCAPDAERKTLGNFGSVTENGGFEDIWFGKDYRKLVSEYPNKSVCRKCTLRRPNKRR